MFDTGGCPTDERCAREKALKLLAIRERTRHELRERLLRSGFSNETAQKVLSSLEAAGIIDDKRFARLWIEERIRFDPVWGPRLRAELRARGVDPEDIEDVLKSDFADVDELELAREAMKRKYRLYSRFDPSKRFGRLAALLRRRGFSHQAIERVLAEFGGSLSDSFGSGDVET